MAKDIELELIDIWQTSPDKKLHPEAVVERAKDPDSPLHSHFEWDDAKAAESHRLNQARQIIQAHVEYLPGVNKEVRAWSSLPADQATGGGYRKTSDVVQRPDWVSQVYEQAARSISQVAKRYEYVAALKPLFERIEIETRQYVEQIKTERKTG